MTPETLQPGRELDAQIETLFFGHLITWLRSKIDSPLEPWIVEETTASVRGTSRAWIRCYTMHNKPYLFRGRAARLYSTDIAAAWRVVEHFNSIRMDTDEGYQRRAKFIFAVPNSIINGTAAEAAYTICLAALKAVGAEPTT